VTSTSPQCLSFYYSLNGATIGALNVYTMTGASLGATATPIWTKNQNIGDSWQPAQTTIQSSSPFKVRVMMMIMRRMVVMRRGRTTMVMVMIE
jgi:hypothetical protein